MGAEGEGETTGARASPAEIEAKIEIEVEVEVEVDRGIHLGERKGLRPEPVFLDPAELTMHAAFLGSSGSGKTTLALNVIEQLLLRGVPAILVDRKGDLAGYGDAGFWAEVTASEGLASHPSTVASASGFHGQVAPSGGSGATHGSAPLASAFEQAAALCRKTMVAPWAATERSRKEALFRRLDVQVFTPGEPRGRPLSLSVVPAGLAAQPSVEQARIARTAAEALGGMMGYKQGGGDELRRTILAKALEYLATVRPETEITLEDVVEVLHAEDPGLVQMVGVLDPKHFNKLKEQLEVLRLSRGELFDRNVERLSAELLLGRGDHGNPNKTRLSIISTKFLGDVGSIEFWVARLLLELASYVSRNPSETLQAVALFDEADIYLPAQRKPPTKEPMQELLRRARSGGLSVMLATQSPGDLDYKCRDNIRSWFVGRITQETAIQKMKPLLSECRTSIEGKLASAKVGDFFQLKEAQPVEIRSGRSVLSTRQIPEHEIAAIAASTRRRP